MIKKVAFYLNQGRKPNIENVKLYKSVERVYGEIKSLVAKGIVPNPSELDKQRTLDFSIYGTLPHINPLTIIQLYEDENAVNSQESASIFVRSASRKRCKFSAFLEQAFDNVVKISPPYCVVEYETRGRTTSANDKEEMTEEEIFRLEEIRREKLERSTDIYKKLRKLKKLEFLKGSDLHGVVSEMASLEKSLAYK